MAHLPVVGGGGLRRDATTKLGLLRGLGRDLRWAGWGRIWHDASVGMSRSRPLSRLTGWYGWDGRYGTDGDSPPISPAHSYATDGTKAPAATPGSTSTGVDENLETRTQHSDHSSPTGPAPNPATGPGRPVPATAAEPRVIDQAQLEASLARLPAPLAARLARLATRHRIIPDDSTSQAPTGGPLP